MAYQTAQMVGVAWRGDVAPVAAHARPDADAGASRTTCSGIPIAGAAGASEQTIDEGGEAWFRLFDRKAAVGRRPRFAALAAPGARRRAQIARGKYLVTIAGCSDCHTPGGMLGSPDMKRYLGGSDVGFSIPGQGVFVGQNLTPDAETGLGKWTADRHRHRDPQGQAARRNRAQRRDAFGRPSRI